MANKRMFSKKIVESDAFLDMPLSSQALYFHLSMEADDDGFVGNAKRIQRAIGAADDDMNILIAKRFVLRHSSGIVIIKHWMINNTIRKDRYTETMYSEIRDLLTVKSNGAYTENTEWQPNGNQMATTGIPNDNQRLPQYSIDKESIGKDRGGEKTKRQRFVPPTLDEIRSFVSENNLVIDPERFFYYYEGNGWMVGRTKMNDWKATARNWDRKDRADGREGSGEAACSKSRSDERIGGLII